MLHAGIALPVMATLLLCTSAAFATKPYTLRDHAHSNLRGIWMAMERSASAAPADPAFWPTDQVHEIVSKHGIAALTIGQERQERTRRVHHRAWTFAAFLGIAGLAASYCILRLTRPGGRVRRDLAICGLIVLLCGIGTALLARQFKRPAVPGFDYVNDYVFIHGVPFAGSREAWVAYERPELRPEAIHLVVLTSHGEVTSIPRSQVIEFARRRVLTSAPG